MKKIIFPVTILAATLFVACKKDRTCSCTVTRVGTSTTEGKVDQVLFGFPVSLADTSFTQDVNDIQTYDKQIKKVTKKSGESNCTSYSQPYNDKTMMSVPAASFNLVINVTEKGTETYNCKLK